MKKKCPKCDYNRKLERRYCQHCGNPLLNGYVRRGNAPMNKASVMKFCKNCGKPNKKCKC